MENQLMTNTVTQVSILDALLASRFDGCLSCRELLKYGDFGIGTFDRMDGEMIILDGGLYQGKTDGKIHTPDPDISTPFATICHFHSDLTWSFREPVNIDAVKKMIDEKASKQNVFHAVRVEGRFSYMKTQVLPLQSKPYRPVAEVVKSCPHFEAKNVSGTIVGFRSPPYVRGIGDPGYHLHFLSEDKTQGGHVLTFDMERGECSVDILSNHLVMLPEEGVALAGVDLSRDLVKEFEESLEK